MQLINFKISEDGKSLHGISETIIKNTLKFFVSTHSKNKMYCFKIIEVTHSEISRNYLYLILGMYSDYTGDTRVDLEKRFLNTLNNLISLNEDADYNKDIFYDKEVTDKESGELIESKLKSISKFSQTAMNRFIDLVSVCISRESPEFKIPDPSKFNLEPKGSKNKLSFPDEIYYL